MIYVQPTNERAGELLLIGPIMDPDAAAEIAKVALDYQGSATLDFNETIYDLAPGHYEKTQVDPEFRDILLSQRDRAAVDSCCRLFELTVERLYGEEIETVVTDVMVGALESPHLDGNSDFRGLVNIGQNSAQLRVWLGSDVLYVPNPSYELEESGKETTITFDHGYGVVLNNRCPVGQRKRHAGVAKNGRTLLRFFGLPA